MKRDGERHDLSRKYPPMKRHQISVVLAWHGFMNYNFRNAQLGMILILVFFNAVLNDL